VKGKNGKYDFANTMKKKLNLMQIHLYGKQLVVYRVTTTLFPGKQPIACLKGETTLSGSDIVVCLFTIWSDQQDGSI
jgi:hypothetical protein